MHTSFNLIKNFKKLIYRWKHAYDSFYISLLLWRLLAVDGIIYLVTGSDPISTFIRENILLMVIYLFTMVSFGNTIKFNIWSNNAYERKDKAIHSELFGLCLIGLYFLFVMLGAEIIWVYPWVDIAVLTIGFILTLRLIRFDFRSDTSEIDI